MNERCLKVVTSIPTFALVDVTLLVSKEERNVSKLLWKLVQFQLLLPLWIELETLLISNEEGKCLKVASIATFNSNFRFPWIELETLLISKEEIKKTIEAAEC